MDVPSTTDSKSVENIDEKASVLENDKDNSPGDSEQSNLVKNNIEDDFSSRAEDEDSVLGGDEPAKELDGNIDEDELLKDTEIEESKTMEINNSSLQCSDSGAFPIASIAKETTEVNLDSCEVKHQPTTIEPSRDLDTSISENDTGSIKDSSNQNELVEKSLPQETTDNHDIVEKSLDDDINNKSKRTVEDPIEPNTDAVLTGKDSMECSDPERTPYKSLSLLKDSQICSDNGNSAEVTNKSVTVGHKGTTSMETDIVITDSKSDSITFKNVVNDVTSHDAFNNSPNLRQESDDNVNNLPLNYTEHKSKDTTDDTNLPRNETESKSVDAKDDEVLSTNVACKKSETTTDNTHVSSGGHVANGVGVSNHISEKDNGTSFEHVDQDSNQQEDDVIDASNEDPFAQTTDIPIESEPQEKEIDSEQPKDRVENAGSMDVDENITTSQVQEAEVNTESTKSIVDPMDLDESIGTSQDQDDVVRESSKSKDNSVESDASLTTTQEKKAGAEKEPSNSSIEAVKDKTRSEVDDSSTDTKVDDNTTIDVPSTVSQDERAIIGISNVVQSEQVENNSGMDTNKNKSDVSIVHNYGKKELTSGISESNEEVSGKSKTGKSLNKSKKQSKLALSDETSEDSDLETVSETSLTRPKRSAAKKAESQIRELSVSESQVEQEDAEDTVMAIENDDIHSCHTCRTTTRCKVNVLTYGKLNYFCDERCFTKFRDGPVPRFMALDGPEIIPPSTVINEIRSVDVEPMERVGFVRKCFECSNVIKNDDEKTLSWETMDFCSEDCLGKYQQELGSFCANCKGGVQPASLGKYCVRFGYEVKQFCCATCLEDFKKGLKVCSFCQKDISTGAEGFLAPVGDKGTFKDFCTQCCMEKYEQMSSNQPPPPQMHPCDVCTNNKIVEIEIFFDNKVSKLCSEICFTAYKFGNNLNVDRCDMCKKYFDKDAAGEKFNIFYEEVPHNFCCKTCMNVYILAKRKIVPCNWCKVKKYNFDMIKRVLNTGQVLMMCSINCLTLYNVSVNAVSSRRVKCDNCQSIAQAQYHLTMSDASIRNFCKYPCVMNFQQQYNTQIMLPSGGGRNDKENIPIPTGIPKRIIHQSDFNPGAPVPLIANVTSMANGPQVGPGSSSGTKSEKLGLVTMLMEPPVLRNKGVQTKPHMVTKSVSCRPLTATQEVQTDDSQEKVLIPIPVPIYVPLPMAMYCMPFPVPIPIPIPIPVPIFLPTTRNSHKGIMKEFKKIAEKTPDDPLEAELLMMADMVAGGKNPDVTSSESEAELEPDTRPASADDSVCGEVASEPMDTSNTFGEDILEQIALTMGSDVEPAEVLTKSSDAASNEKISSKKSVESDLMASKKPEPKVNPKRSGSEDRKRRKTNHTAEASSPATEEVKPDANMKLKYTFGVNAWKSWIAQKNLEIDKLSETNRKIKPFKDNLLQLTADEINFSLCLFVKEVRKPNGTEYAPDTVYYLCLGIQQYIFENGRIDNIFTDSCFEKFTDTLDEVAKKFNEIFNDHPWAYRDELLSRSSQSEIPREVDVNHDYIVTRVEEEHLWESKQLGAHSPHVLLSTLMFFNTKHFNLVNVDEHLLLSFNHIMKHWKRSQSSQAQAGSKTPGSRNVLLRFYPPQSLIDDPNSKKKKMYEQLENEENPLRCPVKLYEFYLSKCPDSVKSRNDVFYLQPERSCVPDSPVWYSTNPLGREPLEKMLNRVKMVKEINVALLTP